MSVQIFKAHTNSVLSVCFSPDGQSFIAGGADKTINRWNIDGMLLKTYSDHTGAVISDCFSPDGKHIVSGDNNDEIFLYRLYESGKRTKAASKK